MTCLSADIGRAQAKELLPVNEPQPAPAAECPACASETLRPLVVSRKTGRVVGGCKACGCHVLLNPPPQIEIVENYEYDREVYESWVAAKRHDSLSRAYDSTLARIEDLIESGGRSLFDVGAGAGEFLAKARHHGYEVHGNELAPGAVQITKERLGIDLHLGDLTTMAGSDLFDALTMWCVLAHVGAQDELLSNARRMLKPGGVLFLQTPRWSAMDVLVLGAARLTGGRITRVLERRVNEYHLTLHSASGLASQLRRVGFDALEVVPRSRYSLQTSAYLTSLGVPQQAGRAASRLLDLGVDRDLFFRNVLDVYARKPHR